MIILQVEDYCHNGCKIFTPQVLIRSDIKKDAIVVCVNRHQCAYARQNIQCSYNDLKKLVNEKYGYRERRKHHDTRNEDVN